MLGTQLRDCWTTFRYRVHTLELSEPLFGKAQRAELFQRRSKKEEINVRKIEVPFFINTYVCTCYYVPRLLPFGRISSQSFQKMNVLLIVRRAFSQQCSIKLLRLHICIGFAYYYKNRGVLGYTWMKSTLAFMYFDTLWKWFDSKIKCAIHPKKFKV